MNILCEVNDMLFEQISAKLNYRQAKPLQFLNKRLAGLWLIWIGLVIIVGTLLGADYGIQPVIFVVGYGAGMAIIFNSKALAQRYSLGPATPFQEKVSNFAIVLMFVLMGLFSGRSFATLDFRMIWLGALLATALHFIPFALVHGPAMVVMAVPLAATAVTGMLLPEIPFLYLGLVDGGIKLLFGLALFARPQKKAVAGKANQN